MSNMFRDNEIKPIDRVFEETKPSLSKISNPMPSKRVSLTGLTLLFLAVLEGIALWLRG